MSDTNLIPLLELQLPKTGYTVKVREYLTTGQSRALQKIILKTGKISSSQDAVMENLSPDAVLEMQDKAAEFLIDSITENGSPLLGEIMDLVGALPVSDGNIVYDKVNELVNASSVTPEDKKK